jgi:hypothetical protein
LGTFGEITLDKKISRYCPFKIFVAAICLRQLAGYLSGIEHGGGIDVSSYTKYHGREGYGLFFHFILLKPRMAKDLSIFVHFSFPTAKKL